MKSIIKAISCAFLIVQLLPAAEWISLGSDKPVEPSWVVDKLSEDLLKVSFSLDGYHLENLKNGKNKISFPNSVSDLKAGAPDLPLNAKSIIIPNLTNISFSITESEYIEVEIDNIVPSKGNLTRNIDPNSIPLSYGKEYETDNWYPQDIVFMREPYIMRSVRGQAIVMKPVQYNPIKKIARI